ncbi:unnamed protein product [Rotaria sordida]|uniref:Uncharacterized protein n=1 Tax=Rotaria sordida TaxID=392033 RepID=A0A815DEA5_9BILA|nr:unnamed protein product [Rotaria sordida]CAF1419078.1 unnamed protein product [Rotaria sordida]CAF1484261.1 unnamed protein product [Rotaria sordida]CAF3903535.1 unnamed protein product [Rotaria sordida]CAF3929217.1 unnamed protein product [Rotaria sordida]
MLRRRVWTVAIVGAAVAAVPLPAVSVAFDLAAIVAEINYYKQQLGLEDEQLRCVANLHGIQLNVLKGLLTDVASAGLFGDVTSLITRLVQQFAVEVTAEEVAHYIPVVGTLISSSIAFGVMRYVLNDALGKCEQAALKLIGVLARNVAQ